MNRNSLGNTGMLLGLLSMMGSYGGMMNPRGGKLVGSGERESKQLFLKICCPKCSGKLKRVCKSPRKYVCKCGFIHIGKLSNITSVL